jgi:hypothetical protein
MLRWSVRGLGSIAIIGLLGWAPVFDWMAPGRIDRAPRPDAEYGRAERLVLLVSIDGLAPRVLTTTATPHLDRLVREGFATTALAGVPSRTMPSHTSMLSGLSPEAHGVRFNRYQPWSRIDTPTVFTECSRARLRCGLFAGKRKLAHFAEFEDGVERYAWGPEANSVLELALDYIREASPDFAFIHLAEVDWAGHEDGWGSDSQRSALRQIDLLLGSFLKQVEALESRPVTVVVTADHGGHGETHGSGRDEDVRVPWIAWGEGIRAAQSPGFVELAATAASVLTLLDLQVPPGWSVPLSFARGSPSLTE